MAVPLYQTSGFVFKDPDVFADSMSTPDASFVYTRHNNPTVRSLELAVADLEAGAAGLATSSGMGAINAVLQAHVRSGDHIVAQRRLYGGAHAALHELSDRFGVGLTLISGDDVDELREALRPETKLLYLETMSNPSAYVSDIPALAAMARAHGVITVVDNTFATPMLFQPLEHGADISIHSVTKYLGGHSDVIGGVAVFADAAVHKHVWHTASELGVTADPFAAWLTLRGLQTLPLRMRRHCENAEFIATRLIDHPAVTAVSWPGFASHPSHERASKLLSGYGGTFSFDLAGGRAAGRAFVTALQLAHLAPSLGGIETVVMHSASISHRKLNAEELKAAGIGEGTIRISVGIEHPQDLWADLEQALNRAAALP
ncbi:methionine gamma-lyase [Rhizocola hellebori]|uniref:homocysteine desulfhydrase n=2 Tax=Rhizocola hellebori TaxID=1392758 RepID=A0A8J3Q484_9ACTN|nr:methionine gamma-lyase [Rhizocola hellebori]